MKKITVIDSVLSKTPPSLVDKVRPFLKYNEDKWTQGQYGREKARKEKFLITKKGQFFTGLFSRVEKELRRRKVQFEVVYPDDLVVRPAAQPNVPGITFRKDQTALLSKIAEQKYSARGIIVAPTGSGKTVVACGIASMYPAERILFTCHTKDLLQQTHEAFTTHGFDSGRLGGGFKEEGHRITVATVQTLARKNPTTFFDAYSVLIVDECHRVNDSQKQYGELVQNLYAPVKLGLTATEPEKLKGKLLLEGLIGPVLGKFTLEDGIEQGVLAQPKLVLLPVRINSKIADLRKYRDIYVKGIVENRLRNTAIVDYAKSMQHGGKSTLIIVKEVKHGNLLQKMFTANKIKAHFVNGATPAKLRKEVKDYLQSKKYNIVLCTDVWREGINIPSLDCIINACGGKGEIMTLQAIGRGLRVWKDKDCVYVVDFLDPYKYLAQHAMRRMGIYAREGWL